MASTCFVCGKKNKAGNTVSHSNRHVKRVFSPNLQRVKFIVKGKKFREYVCTTCIKSGKVEKN